MNDHCEGGLFQGCLDTYNEVPAKEGTNMSRLDSQLPSLFVFGRGWPFGVVTGEKDDGECRVGGTEVVLQGGAEEFERRDAGENFVGLLGLLGRNRLAFLIYDLSLEALLVLSDAKGA